MATANPLTPYLTEFGYGAHQLPKIAGTFTGQKLIICADSSTVWDDLERFGARNDVNRGSVYKPGWHIMTVNKIVEVMPANIHHAYSNDPNLLAKYLNARRDEYEHEFESPRTTHSCNTGARHLWPLGGHGTSGLCATLVGVGLGYDEIVLCGLGLTDGPHNGEPPWRKTRFTREAANSGDTGMNHHWRKARDLCFRGRVKSMSGRTREWLGAPQLLAS
jgi:hypothetical protein